MGKGINAGTLYFAAVFAIGFLLGTVRVLLLEDRVGRLVAALIELPVMLTAAWLICGWVLRRNRVPAARVSRVAMGATAFLLLMVAELAVSTMLLNRTAAEHLATYRMFDKQLGLGAQLLFAAMPMLRR